MTAQSGLPQVVARVLQQVGALTGYPTAGASAASRTDDGWQLEVDVVEVSRVPATTSLLATYEVQASDGGDVLSYRRVRRFHRNATDGER
jgi:hypothetical protein